MANVLGNLIGGLSRSALAIAITLVMFGAAGLALLFTLACAPPLGRLHTP